MTLAVVPIFVNAGAALLPTLIAAFTALLALILSPRALFALFRRKPWLPLLILTLAIACYFLPALFPKASATTTNTSLVDWPALAQDLLRQQQSPDAILTPLWHNDLDGHMALSTPALFTDSSQHTTLYLPATFLDVAAKFGALFALDATPDTGRGKTLWKATSDLAGNDLKPFFSSPAITPHGSFLIVGQGLHDDADCPLLCFDLRFDSRSTNRPDNSRVTWAVKTPLHVESSPAIFTRNGTPFAVVGAGAIEGPDRLPIGNPGYVFCVDISTGKQLWQFPLNDPESSPAVDEDGIVYIGSGFNGNAVVALRSDPDSDLHNQPRLKWRTPTPYPAVGNVTLTSHPTLGNILLIGLGNGDYVFSDPHPAGLVLALDRNTGKIQWQTPLPDSVLGPITVIHDTILAGCRDGHACALDLATGKILWQATISTTPNTPILAGLAADNSHAFALAADATLAVLSLADGRLLERLKLSDESKAPQNLSLSTPLYRNHTLYVATETTGLHAFSIHP